MRLELFATGRLNLAHSAFVPVADGQHWTVRIAASTRLSSADQLLSHKTSRRTAYEAARAEYTAGDADEALLLHARGEVCEGTIPTLFLPDGPDRYLTPPLACGLLAGVERQRLIDSGHAREAVILPDALRDQRFFLGNSLRGLIPARLAP